METRLNNLVLTLWMKWSCYSRLSVFATAIWFLNTWLVLWNVLPQSWCAVHQSYSNQPRPLFVVCLHSFPALSAGVDIRGCERERATSGPLLLRDSAGTLWEFALSFCLAFSGHRPNLFWNDQKVNSVITCSMTNDRKVSAKKNRFLRCSVKKLMNNSKPTF